MPTIIRVDQHGIQHVSWYPDPEPEVKPAKANKKKKVEDADRSPAN